MFRYGNVGIVCLCSLLNDPPPLFNFALAPLLIWLMLRCQVSRFQRPHSRPSSTYVRREERSTRWCLLQCCWRHTRNDRRLLSPDWRSSSYRRRSTHGCSPTTRRPPTAEKHQWRSQKCELEASLSFRASVTFLHSPSFFLLSSHFLLPFPLCPPPLKSRILKLQLGDLGSVVSSASGVWSAAQTEIKLGAIILLK